MKRVGVYGGTFDPIHIGHLAAAQETAEQLALDQVLFVPNNRPPLKQGRTVSAAADRLAMVRLAVEGNSLFDVSTIELERQGLSYTLDTLRMLRAALGSSTDLFFLAGCDALADLHTWHRPHDLLDEFQIVIMDRPTDSVIDWDSIEAHFPSTRTRVQIVRIPLLQISAEDLRRRVREHRPIRYYVTPPVERYIRERGLYRVTEAP